MLSGGCGWRRLRCRVLPMAVVTDRHCGRGLLPGEGGLISNKPQRTPSREPTERRDVIVRLFGGSSNSKVRFDSRTRSVLKTRFFVAMGRSPTRSEDGPARDLARGELSQARSRRGMHLGAHRVECLRLAMTASMFGILPWRTRLFVMQYRLCEELVGTLGWSRRLLPRTRQCNHEKYAARLKSRDAGSDVAGMVMQRDYFASLPAASWLPNLESYD